jgi:branched-chain amino acid transport system substrate-binding protein
MKKSTLRLAALAGVGALVISLPAGAATKKPAKKGGAKATTTAAPTTAAPTTAAPTTAGPTTIAKPADPLGTPTAAKGTPVKIGYFSDGNAPAIDNTADWKTATATVKYANEYLGGIGGHPIELIVCEGIQDPAVTADCGNKFVQKGVAAVMLNVSGQAGAVVKPIQDANIPIFAFATAAAEFVGYKYGFTLSNPVAGIAFFPAGIAAKNKFTRAAMMVIDVPGATGPAKALGVPVFQGAGVPKLDVVAIAPGTADMTPQVQAMLGADPQVVHIIGNPAFCLTAIKTLRDVNYKGVISMISNCLDEVTIKTLGDKLKGIQVSYAAGEDPKDPDTVILKAVINKYAKDQKLEGTGTDVGAYAVVIGFSRVMKAATGDITPASVIATIQSAPALPLPTIKGATFQCNGKQVPGIAVACTGAYATAVLDEKGKPTFAA